MRLPQLLRRQCQWVSKGSFFHPYIKKTVSVYMFFCQAITPQLSANAMRAGITLAPGVRSGQLSEMWKLVKGTDAVRV